jgi:hypothetical protein
MTPMWGALCVVSERQRRVLAYRLASLNAPRSSPHCFSCVLVKEGTSRNVADKTGLSVDEQIDALIEKRAKEFEEQERIDQGWAESAMRHNLGARAAMRQEWAEHYRRMVAVHERLAEENRARLIQLIDEGM